MIQVNALKFFYCFIGLPSGTLNNAQLLVFVIFIQYALHLGVVYLIYLFISTSQTNFHGDAFIRLHAPWQVLSREAEFLKIKVPTKKVSTLIPHT